MDINMLGLQHFDQARNPFSSTAASGFQSGESFEEILRRMQDVNRPFEQKEAGRWQDSAFSARASKMPPIDKSSQLYEVCMELETILIKNLIKGMRDTVQKTNLIDTGFAGEVYEDMLYDEYAKSFARNASLGFAEMAYRDLTGYR